MYIVQAIGCIFPGRKYLAILQKKGSFPDNMTFKMAAFLSIKAI